MQLDQRSKLMRNLIPTYLALAFIASALTSATTWGQTIQNRSVDNVGIGDSASKIYSTFEQRYKIKKIEKPNEATRIHLEADGKTVVTFEISNDGRIFHISVYGVYSTLEHVGPGSMLGDVVRVYGKARIFSTDSGYLLSFPKMKGIGFQLNGRDMPKHLRDIPDDGLSPKQEQEILSLRTIKIRAILLYMDE